MPRLIVGTVVVVLSCLAGRPSVGAAEPNTKVRNSDAATARIEKALNEPTTVEYLSTPLGDVATDVALRHEINVKVDWPALAVIGKGSCTPISQNLNDVPLAKTLDLLLWREGLEWTVADGILWITTAEGARSTKVYSVAEFAERPGFDYDELQDLIERMVERQSWQSVGGTIGAIHTLPRLQSLIVTTTYRTHRELKALLAMLSRSEAEKNKGDVSGGTPLAPRDAVDEALRTKTEVHYLNTPLADVVTDLELRHRLNIEINHEDLLVADGRKEKERTFSLDLENVPLVVVLNRLLHPNGLDWVVVDGVVLLTTGNKEKRDDYSEVREYPIGDFVAGDDWDEASEDLRETLANVVTPEEWRETGGTTADVAPFATTKSLLIRHDERGHRAIASLLRQLREVRTPETVDAANDRAEELIVRFYSIVDLDAAVRAGEKDAVTESQGRFIDDASSLIRTLQHEVRPGQWSVDGEHGPTIYADRLTRSLVIRQTRAGHRDVNEFLQKVDNNLNGWFDHPQPFVSTIVVSPPPWMKGMNTF